MAGGAAAPAADSLPCLFVTTQRNQPAAGANLPPQSSVNISAFAKKAETLFVNADGLIKRVGIGRVGFVTLTFAERIVDFKEASRRFNILSTRVLKPLGMEFISVPERQASGRFHFHLICAFPDDIRTGFDFGACERANAAKRDGHRDEFRREQKIFCRSANRSLREVWALFRSDRVTRYGFGRCETLPVLSNAAAVARYVGSYVTSAGCHRLASDKGMRSVRYSMRQRLASIRWSWSDGNGAIWRRGCKIISLVMDLPYEDYSDRFGKKWAWHMKETITELGRNFDQALGYAVKVPEWADRKSRLLFLARLSAELAGVKEWLLPNVSFGSETDEPAIGFQVIDVEKIENEYPF